MGRDGLWPNDCGDSGTDEAWRRAKTCSCFIDVMKESNLRSVKRVSFWVRGERGEEVVEFKVGDKTMCPSPAHSSGLVTLTAGWQRYEIDLEGFDMKKSVALFTWVATDLHNPEGATFYLDDVQFEGTR